MSWLNGRSGDLVFEGTFTADVGGSIGIGSLYTHRPGLVTRAFMDDLGVDLDITSVVCSLTGGKFRVEVSGNLVAKTPWGDTTTSVSWFSETTPPTRNTDVRSMGGTWSITIPVEDVEDYTGATIVEAADVPGDGPLPKKFICNRQLLEGGTVTVTATLGGYTATKTHVIAAGDVTTIDHYCSATVEAATGQQGGVTPSTTASTTRTYCSGSLPLKTARSVTSGGHSGSASDGNLSVTCSNPGTVTTEIVCSGVVTSDWPREYKFDGRYRNWNLAGPDALIARAHTGPSTYVDIPAIFGLWGNNTWQYKDSVAFNLDGSTSSWAIDETAPVYVFLKDSSLSAFAEDTTDWRCLISGVSWLWADLVHAGTNTLEDGSSASDWSADSHTTVSATGGAIRFVVAGGSGGGTWTPAATVKSEGYRYLRVRIKAAGATKPFIVGIGSKTWTRATVGAGAYADVDIDLCCPDGSSGSDNKSSRYALSGYLGDPVDTALWGVSRIASIVISGLEDGETYEIDSISLIRSSWAKYSLASSFNNWFLAWTSGSDNTYTKSFFWSDVDGRVTDQPDVFHVVPFTGADYYNRYTLSQLVSLVDELGGWTITENVTTFPDSYHTNSLDAYHAGGAGSVVDHSTGTWTDQIDVSATGSVGIKAQALWDQVEVPPLWGNGWDRGAYPQGTDALADRQTPIRWNKILRGHAWGLVFDSALAPSSGVTATLVQSSDSSNRGDDTTDSIGVYVTDDTYGHGATSHYVEISVGSAPTVSVTVANRMRHRASWVAFAAVAGSWPSLWIHPTERTHYRAYIEGGTIWFGWADNAFTYGYADTDTAISATSVCIVGERKALIGAWRLYLYYEDAGTVYVKTSTDRGVSWSVSTSIGTGKTPAVAIGADGVRFVYRVVTGSPNVVKVKRYDAAGNLLGSEATAVSGVDDAGVAVEEWNLPGGLRKIELLCVVGGAVTRYTSSDGITFV